MIKKPQISIVIPSYNSELYIRSCLWSLMHQQTALDYETILVDSSTDDTPKIVKEIFPSAQLIHLERKTMPGAARNIGVNTAKAEIIAFIDSDCVAPPEWLNECMRAISQGYSIVGGAVRNGNPKNLIGYADFFISFSKFFPGMPKREITTVLGTFNFICKKSAFDQTGNFHPEWLTGEDYLFCMKAIKKFKLLFDPQLVVYHINRRSLKAFFRHQLNYGKYSAKLRKKLKVPGSFFAKYPFLAVSLILLRFMMISSRIIRWNRQLLLKYFLVTPLIIIGLIPWWYGFIKQSLGNS